MASVYVLAETVRERLGDRADVLLDRDGDGTEDAGLLDELIAEAGDEINMRLAQRLGTPFADVTADPPTPTEIQRIALWIVLADCYAWTEPDGRDATVYREKANATLTALADGTADIPSAPRVSASRARHVVSYETQADAVFAGVTGGGTKRIRGI